MRKLILFLTVLTFAVFGAQNLFAAECVEVEVELTPEVVAGETIEGYFELTNCGDDAAVITLALTIELFNGQTIELPGFPVEMGAGETIARDFSFIAPPPFAGNTFGLCITATSGDAEASDCASTTILEGSLASGEKDNFGIDLSMNTDDCVETEFELSDTVTTTPGDFFAEGYFELTNCGDEAATVWLELSIENLDVGPINVPVELGAGETVTRELYFPVPPAVPEGDYTICITATAGEAMSTSCETIHVIAWTPPEESENDGDLSINNYPNPFNPATNIAFTLPAETTVSLKVYNMLGQHVETLVNEEALSAGKHQVSWDGTNLSGNQVSSGVYFYRLETENTVISKQMILVK
ncbi:MAG: T9SS type A sorting domain-containing protein [candidate division Zixibacteria bacterium]|nr:T9SS type A sorting domain-containing protein [candidate division Zixibacteria bacterium]